MFVVFNFQLHQWDFVNKLHKVDTNGFCSFFEMLWKVCWGCCALVDFPLHSMKNDKQSNYINCSTNLLNGKCFGFKMFAAYFVFLRWKDKATPHTPPPEMKEIVTNSQATIQENVLCANDACFSFWPRRLLADSTFAHRFRRQAGMSWPLILHNSHWIYTAHNVH